jgi:hypothetical protein
MERYGYSARARQPLAKDAKSKQEKAGEKKAAFKVNNKAPWEVPKNWKPLTPDGFSVANKGMLNKDNVQADRCTGGGIIYQHPTGLFFLTPTQKSFRSWPVRRTDGYRYTYSRVTRGK